MSSIRVILNSILSEMEKKRQKGKRDKLEKGSGTPKLDNKFEFASLSGSTEGCLETLKARE